jgi:hypothetical protein
MDILSCNSYLGGIQRKVFKVKVIREKMDKTEDFKINYVHTEPCLSNKHCPVKGYFEVTLDGRQILDENGESGHDTDYVFEPDKILDCAIVIGMGRREKLQFNRDRRRFALYFSPLEREMVEVSEETTPGLRVRVPRRDVIRNLVDCYDEVCRQNEIPIDIETKNEYQRYLQ